MEAFKGRRFMRGRGLGGVIKKAFRFATPYIKKGAAYLLGKLFESGSELMHNVQEGKPFKESVRKNLKRTKDQVINETKSKIKKTLFGRGCKVKRKRLKLKKTKNKRAKRIKKSVKKVKKKKRSIIKKTNTKNKFLF